MKFKTTVVTIACFAGTCACSYSGMVVDFSDISLGQCEKAIYAYESCVGDGWSDSYGVLSNYVAVARDAVVMGENPRKVYEELTVHIIECKPPSSFGEKRAYYYEKFAYLQNAIGVIMANGKAALAKNRDLLEASARFIGHIRGQYEIYKEAKFLVQSVAHVGETGERLVSSKSMLVHNNQMAGIKRALKDAIASTGHRTYGYSYYYHYGFYEKCIAAGLTPEFVDRLAVLAKVPSGTFKPDPPPKLEIPKPVASQVQTNTISAAAASVTEQGLWPEPHPVYYDDVDEMWEGEDNGGDAYWYCFSEGGWGRCMKDTASEADLVPQEIKPEGALAERMRRYGMKAYRVGNDSETYRFLLYVPKTKRREKLPMIVYFPGNGEIGEDLTKQFNQSGLFDKVTSAQFQKRHPCALIAVSPPTRMCCYTTGMKDHPGATTRLFHRRFRRMLNMLDDIIDRNRIYVTGFSWGGHAVYAMGMYYANEFAALFPISTVALADRNVNEKHPGNWWHVANEKDRVADEGCREDVEAFRKKVISFGGDFQVSYFPDNGHDAWTNAWKEDQIWDWMFSKSLEQGKAAGREGRRDGRLAISMADAKCSASVPGADATCGPERVIDLMQRTSYVAARDFTDKDWWMVEFPNPVEGEVRMTSGDAKGRGKLKGAYAEVSIDGRSWVRGGGFSKETGECRFTPRQPFRFLRVRSALTSPQHFELRQLLILSAKQ